MDDKKYLKTLLISETKLKSETLIQKNVSARILSATIQKIQNEKLKIILGDEFYNDILIEAYKKATIDGYILSNDIIILLDEYIQPYLIHTCIAELFDTLENRISNKGIKKKNDDNSSSLNSLDLENLRKRYLNDSINYKSNLIDYLQANNISSGSNDLSHGSFEATGVLFDDNIIVKNTKKSGGIWSGKSWTPLTAFENFDGKLLKVITGYVGGEGTLPKELENRIGMYFTGDGNLTFNKDDAEDFRGNGGVDKTFEFEQITPSNEWRITHNLSKYPSCQIFDTAYTQFLGEVEQIDKNNLIIRFNFPISGYAFLN